MERAAAEAKEAARKEARKRRDLARRFPCAAALAGVTGLQEEDCLLTATRLATAFLHGQRMLAQALCFHIASLPTMRVQMEAGEDVPRITEVIPEGEEAVPPADATAIDAPEELWSKIAGSVIEQQGARAALRLGGVNRSAHSATTGYLIQSRGKVLTPAQRRAYVVSMLNRRIIEMTFVKWGELPHKFEPCLCTLPSALTSKVLHSQEHGQLCRRRTARRMSYEA